MRSATARHVRPRLGLRDRLLASRKPLMLAGGLLLAGWLVVGGGADLLRRLATEAMTRSSASMGYRVASIDFVGRQHANQAVLDFLMSAHIDQPIFSVDLASIRRDLEDQYPWIEQATVRRVLPDRIVIELAERQPVALWQNQAQLMLVDAKGHPITADPADLERFLDLPQVIGAEAPAADATSIAALANARLPGTAIHMIGLLTRHQAITAQVQAARWTDGRRWSLLLKTGVVIELPEAGVARTMAMLERLATETDLLVRDIEAIDLRVPDKVIVRTPDHRLQVPQKPDLTESQRT